MLYGYVRGEGAPGSPIRRATRRLPAGQRAAHGHVYGPPGGPAAAVLRRDVTALGVTPVW
ncbi:hypothetical protein QJS66_04830 [Kocuria rhizophila]|nr:hypothetical protein QJS66_04830 [Kocuria rhizophila]